MGYKKHHHANSTTLLHAFFITIIISSTHSGMGGVCRAKGGGRLRPSAPSFCTTRQEETRGRGGQTCRRPFEPSLSRISNCCLRGFREVLSMFSRGWRRDPTSDRHAGAGTLQKTNTHTWQNQCQQAGWCYDGILASTTITNPRLPRRLRRRLDNRQPLERTKNDERSSQWGHGFRFSKCPRES